MSSYSLFIEDVVAEASPFLKRMRMDGLDHAALPFPAPDVHAWLHGNEQGDMEAVTVCNVIKVRFRFCACSGRLEASVL